MPVLALPALLLSWWTSMALYEFLRAYRSAGDLIAKATTYPVEPAAFAQHMSRPIEALARTPGLTLGTFAAALRHHSDVEVERLRRRYVVRLALLLAAIPLWLTITILLFRG